MECYSAIKNTSMSFAGKCRELESIILSEITQSQKGKFLREEKRIHRLGKRLMKWAKSIGKAHVI